MGWGALGLWGVVAPGMREAGHGHVSSSAVPLRLEGGFGLSMDLAKTPHISEERPAHHLLILTC